MTSEIRTQPTTAAPGRLRGAFDSDLWFSFSRNPVAAAAAMVTVLCVGGAVFAPWIAPHDPYDLATFDLFDNDKPPVWLEGGEWRFLLGTDGQGRDVLSTILYGGRVSLLVGFSAILFSLTIGVTLGLIAGYVGGTVDAVIMRITDIKLSFPAILIALMIDGIARAALPREVHASVALYVVIFAIGMVGWPGVARIVRGSTMVERRKEYVQAARLVGLHPASILLRHILPNVMGPVLVFAPLGLGTAILGEATLSFLGVGVPVTQPSLGTLIRIGSDFLFSGEWWITIFPGVGLVVLVLAVNLLSDWLRDALNPRLR